MADADELTRRAAAAEPDNAEAAHMLGIIAHQSGKTAEAIDHLRRAIAIKPDVALYHANLGEMCRLAGRIDEAIAAGRRALEINPNYAGALSNLGIALFDQGKFDEALSLYDRAIALESNFAQAHSNRGNALQRLKRFAEAEKAYRRAIELQPNFADAWNNLGTCLRELKRSEEAEAVYRKALELAPNNPDTLDNLALALKDLDRLDEAADLMRRALIIEPRDEKLFVHYATVLLDQHKIDEAAAATERALALNANNHDAVNLMGRIAFERGDLARCAGALPARARAQARPRRRLQQYGQRAQGARPIARRRRTPICEALRLDPNIAGVYVNLADSKKFAPGDPHLAAMEALAAKTDGLSKTDRLQLDFALGKAYADLKDYRRSFTHLLAGNAAKRARSPMTRPSRFALFDRIEAVFTRDLIAQKSGGGDPSPHADLRHRHAALGHDAGRADHRQPSAGAWRRRIADVQRRHPHRARAGRQSTAAIPISCRRSMPRRCARSAPAMSPLVRKLAPSGERVTDKMPSNYYFAGLIHLALPNAKIIHTIRDPVDTCISCFSKLFTAEQNHTYDLGELGRYYKRYEQLMAHWRRVLPASTHPRRALRRRRRRSRKAGAPHHRLLRPALGRPLPVVPRNRAAGADRERDAGAPADL